MKFNAAIQGVDLEDDNKKAQNIMFPHPDTFRNMSDEEKKKKTKEQMAIHKMMLPQKMRM